MVKRDVQRDGNARSPWRGRESHYGCKTRLTFSLNWCKSECWAMLVKRMEWKQGLVDCFTIKVPLGPFVFEWFERPNFLNEWRIYHQIVTFPWACKWTKRWKKDLLGATVSNFFILSHNPPTAWVSDLNWGRVWEPSCYLFCRCHPSWNSALLRAPIMDKAHIIEIAIIKVLKFTTTSFVCPSRRDGVLNSASADWHIFSWVLQVFHAFPSGFAYWGKVSRSLQLVSRQ